MLQGFILGLSGGAACAVYCAPVLVPYLLGEAGGVRRSGSAVALFLAGRLAGYLLFATAAWAAGAILLGSGKLPLIAGPAYVVLAVLLAIYGAGKPRSRCAAGSSSSIGRRLGGVPWLLPLVLGFLTGLNLCPPFLTALVAAGEAPTLGGSLLFFLMFFVGTSLYVLPAALLGAAGRFPKLQLIGRLAACVMALYYFYAGILRCAAGIEQVIST
ncbi:MAG: sulfite exporter TauE/SafE family protein [Acidobacteriota bacterium]